MRALVVGGGITGLTAAHAFSRAGVPVTIVEAESRLGGKVATERASGFLLERGPDAFLAVRPDAVSLAREVGLGAEIVAPQKPGDLFVWHRERLLRVPEGTGLGIPTRFRPFVTSALFSPAEKVRAALELVVAAHRGDRADESIGAFLRRRFGGAVVDRLAGPLISAVYGTGIDELSLLALQPRLREAVRTHGSLIRAGIAARAGRAAGGPALVTLARGLGSLVEAVCAHTVADVRLGVRVARLDRAGGRYAARLDDATRIEADVVVIATPAPVTARILADLAPVASRALGAIDYRGTAAVSLAYAASQLPAPLLGHGFVVSEGTLAVDACSWTSAKWPGRAPEDYVLLRAAIRDERLVAADRDALVEAAHAAVARALRISGRPALTRVARWAGAMPRYTVGHLDRIAAVERALAGHPRLALAGAAYRGSGVPDCIAQGEAAASRLLRA